MNNVQISNIPFAVGISKIDLINNANLERIKLKIESGLKDTKRY
jgi:hypothetical protein